MSTTPIHIPYIDELLFKWNDFPEIQFIKKLNHFETSILLLSSYAIHLDKTENWFEINFIKKFYTSLFNEAIANYAVQFVQLKLTNEIDIAKLCFEIKRVASEKILLQLLFYFFDLSVSDGKLHDEELEFIESLKTKFEISESNYQTVFTLYAMYNPSFRKEKIKNLVYSDEKLTLAYQLFGLSKNATREELKEKYKALVKKHHPDKVTHLSTEHINKATELIKKINQAYDYIERKFLPK